MVMYFVRTVCELIRLNNETELPFMMHVETLRVFAVFFGAVFLTTILAGADAEGACCVGGVLAGVKVNGVGSTLIRGCRGGACG